MDISVSPHLPPLGNRILLKGMCWWKFTEAVVFFCPGFRGERPVPDGGDDSWACLVCCLPVTLATQRLGCPRIRLVSQVAFSHKYGWNQWINQRNLVTSGFMNRCMLKPHQGIRWNCERGHSSHHWIRTMFEVCGVWHGDPWSISMVFRKSSRRSISWSPEDERMPCPQSGGQFFLDVFVHTLWHSLCGAGRKSWGPSGAATSPESL